jgi:hypothetical protein
MRSHSKTPQSSDTLSHVCHSGGEGDKGNAEDDDGVVDIPNLKTRSVQEILNNSDMASIDHHGGSGNTYMATKILKLQTLHNPAGSSNSGLVASSSIFQGCFLFVNGDTTPTRYEIQRLVSLRDIMLMKEMQQM